MVVRAGARVRIIGAPSPADRCFIGAADFVGKVGHVKHIDKVEGRPRIEVYFGNSKSAYFRLEHVELLGRRGACSDGELAPPSKMNRFNAAGIASLRTPPGPLTPRPRQAPPSTWLLTLKRVARSPPAPQPNEPARACPCSKQTFVKFVSSPPRAQKITPN